MGKRSGQCSAAAQCSTEAAARIGLLASRQPGLPEGAPGRGRLWASGSAACSIAPGVAASWSGALAGSSVCALEGRAHDPGALGGCSAGLLVCPTPNDGTTLPCPLAGEGRGWRQVGHSVPRTLARCTGCRGASALGQQVAACACGKITTTGAWASTWPCASSARHSGGGGGPLRPRAQAGHCVRQITPGSRSRARTSWGGRIQPTRVCQRPRPGAAGLPVRGRFGGGNGQSPGPSL